MTDYQFEMGDHVRIDIPDEMDSDYSRLHGRHSEIIAILEDDAGAVTVMIATPCCTVFSWMTGQKRMFGGAIFGHPEVSLHVIVQAVAVFGQQTLRLQYTPTVW